MRNKLRLAALLAAIPLFIYSLGIPIEVLFRGSGYVVRDNILPFEVIGLTFCSAIVAYGLWSETKNGNPRDPN